MAITDARRRANKKYDDKVYEYYTVKIKKGAKEAARQVLRAGESANSFAVGAILAEIERRKNAPTADSQARTD